MNSKINEDTIKKALLHAGYREENNFRHFSVLIPMVEVDGEMHLIYEVRSASLNRQPGEICFPGGEVEDDETYEECALRETWEEIGLPAEDLEITGELTVVYGVGGFAMHCFPAIAGKNALDRIDINEEVEEIFTVPLKRLLNTEEEMYHAGITQAGPEDFPYKRVTGGDDYPWSRLTSPVPVYDIGDRVIWGLTGRATKVLLDVIREEVS